MNFLRSLLGANNITQDQYYRLSNQELCHEAAVLHKDSSSDTVVKFDCFNREEAFEIEQYMKEKYPHIPFFTTWLDFK